MKYIGPLLVMACLGALLIGAAALMNDRAARAREVCWQHSVFEHPRDAFASRDQCLEDLGYGVTR